MNESPVNADRPRQVGYRVMGRVQGVGYRWWTCRVARTLGLRGTGRNCADASVEIHVTGEVVAIRDFESRLLQGPAGAVVQSVEPFESTVPLPEDDFRIVG